MITILSWVLSCSVIAMVLGLCGWVATRRRHAAVGHGFYILALVKLITPPVIAIPLWGFADQVVPTGAVSIAANPGVLSVSSPSTLSASAFSWGGLALAVWLLGSAVMLVVLVIRWVRLNRWVLGMRAVSGSVQADLNRCAGLLGMARSPRAHVVEAQVSPMLCATTRGLRIVVPARILATLSPEALESLFLHELAHAKRGDWLVRFLEAVVGVVCWWNPCAYFLRRELRHAEELCCDAWVMWVCPDSEASYAEALVATTEFVVGTPPLASGIGPIRALRQRVEGLGSRAPDLRVTARSKWVAALLALGLLPIVACEGPATVTLPAANSGGRTVAIMGAVDGRQRVSIPSHGLSLLEAVQAATPSTDADLSRVLLVSQRGPFVAEWNSSQPGGKRALSIGEPLSMVIDVEKILQTGATRSNVALSPLDLIYLPRQGEPLPEVKLPTVSEGPRILINKSRVEIGDLVCCVVSKSVVEQPGCENLAELTKLQQIGGEGTIFVPYVGSVKVLGLTESAASALIRSKLAVLFNNDLELQVRISE